MNRGSVAHSSEKLMTTNVLLMYSYEIPQKEFSQSPHLARSHTAENHLHTVSFPVGGIECLPKTSWYTTWAAQYGQNKFIVTYPTTEYGGTSL